MGPSPAGAATSTGSSAETPSTSTACSYLDGFARFVREHENEIPALLVVTQRPRELTREQLKSLRLALDRAGYPEAHLRSAWRDRTNQDIAASIIGYVRQAALGDALTPYEERVALAMRRVLASRAWTAPQRQWLERIGKQLRQELVLDRASLDAERQARRLHPPRQDLRRPARDPPRRPRRRGVGRRGVEGRRLTPLSPVRVRGLQHGLEGAPKIALESRERVDGAERRIALDELRHTMNAGAHL